MSFDPSSLAHLPDISGHVITSVRAQAEMKAGDIGYPVDAHFGGVTIARVKIVPPGPPARIGPSGRFLPLGLGGKALPGPGGICPGVIPSHAHDRLEGF